MISDVPLGAFLSGGIDSSTIAALMLAAGKGPVRTFSIGFPELGFDESKHAAAVAHHLGTQHEELVVTAADALAVVPKIPDIYDEPFADSSQIPTYLVSQLTRARVTVALSGDGGDELFAGYNRYTYAEKFAAFVLSMPLAMRRACSGMLDALPAGAIDKLARLAPKGTLPAQPADKLKKLAAILPCDARGLYLRLVSQCPEPARLMPGIEEHAIAWDRAVAGTAAICSTACSGSTPPPIFPTTSCKRSTVPRWRSRWRCALRCSIIAWWRSPSGCRGGSVSATARANGCCVACSTATCRVIWSSGRRWDLACRSPIGCAGRCATGPRTCSTRCASAGG